MSEKLKKLAEKSWKHYQSKMLTGDRAKYEPKWVLPPYCYARDYLADPKSVVEVYGIGAEKELEQDLKSVLDLRIRQFKWLGQHRVSHDGWKVTTSSWVFMGRGNGHLSFSTVNPDLVICSRVVPPEVLKLMPYLDTSEIWIAYSLTDPMGNTTLTSNCYGPCSSFKELVAVIESEEPYWDS